MAHRVGVGWLDHRVRRYHGDFVYEFADRWRARHIGVRWRVQSLVANMTVGSNISEVPLLDSNFNLTTGSKCIDVGTSAEAPAVDKHFLARPQNGMFDIGADEF